MFRQLILFIVIVVAMVTLVSCMPTGKKLTLAVYLPGSDSHLAGQAIKQSLAELGWKIDLVNMSHEDANEALRNGQVDLAITSNEASLSSQGLRTIIPLYSEVLISLMRDNSVFMEVDSIENLLSVVQGNKANFLFSYEGSYAHLFAEKLLKNEGIEPEMFNAIYFKEKTAYKEGKKSLIQELKPDIVFLLNTPINPLANDIMELGYSIRNIDGQSFDLEYGFLSSFATRLPRSYPIVIPAFAMSRKQTEPIGTLGIKTSLICSKELDENLVYDFVKDLMWSQPELIELNPQFFEMSEDFDQRFLNYRVHPGSQSYFERDEPGFFERYAELTGVMFSMVVVLFGLMTGLRRVYSQRQKDRIDEYYLHLIEARQEKDISVAILRVQELEEKALNQLVQEKLSADNAFVVLMQLIDQIRRELKDKLQD